MTKRKSVEKYDSSKVRRAYIAICRWKVVGHDEAYVCSSPYEKTRRFAVDVVDFVGVQNLFPCQGAIGSKDQKRFVSR